MRNDHFILVWLRGSIGDARLGVGEWFSSAVGWATDERLRGGLSSVS
jgi:hypothetical protein